MTMTSKVIEHLAAEGIHESNVAVECGDEVSRLVLRGDDGCYRVCETNRGSTEDEEGTRKKLRTSNIVRTKFALAEVVCADVTVN